MAPSKRRLSLSLFLLGHAYSSLALALPGSASNNAALPRRADTAFYTAYGIYDSSPHPSAVSDGSPKLVPVSEVFMVMKQQAVNVATAAAAATPSPQTASATAAASTTSAPSSVTTASTTTTANSTTTASSAHTTATPPHTGPGLVVLSSSVLRALLSATPTPTANAKNTASATSATTTPLPSKRIMVLGGVIGGIIFFCLLLFLLLDPGFNGRICACFRTKKKTPPAPKEMKQSNVPEILKVKNDTSSWVTVIPVHRESLETIKEMPESIRDSILDIRPQSERPLTSKFSMCSSEYPASTRDSGVPSDSDDSSASTVKFATPNPEEVAPTSSNTGSSSPVRPPRPPTADSPVLSDSVYLACSDQPYVIVAPEPLADADIHEGVIADTPKRMLTPAEFLAIAQSLRDYEALDSRVSASNIAASSATTDVKRNTSDTRHSRTRSAPLLSGGGGDTDAVNSVVNTATRLSKDQSKTRHPTVTFSQVLNFPSAMAIDGAGGDTENESDVQELEIARRVMKHRRSRSASGWAYRARSHMARRPFRLEE